MANFIHNTFIAAQFLFLKSSILEVAIILPKNLIWIFLKSHVYSNYNF